jgi:hypothetical protein
VPTDEFFKRIAESQDALDADALERPTGTAARRVARPSSHYETKAELEDSSREAGRESALEEEGDAGEAIKRAPLWPRQLLGAAAIAVVVVIATAALDGKRAKPTDTNPAPAASSVARVPMSVAAKRPTPRRPVPTPKTQKRPRPPGHWQPAQTTAGSSGTTSDPSVVVGSPSPAHDAGAVSVEEFGFEGR